MLTMTMTSAIGRALTMLALLACASCAACASSGDDRPGAPDAAPDGPLTDGPQPPIDAPPIDAPPREVIPSCERLAPTCGPAGDESCCATLEIPAGMYFRSHDAADDSRFGDQNAPARVSGFRLDKYEITVGRFRAFVAAGQGTQQKPPDDNAGSHPRIRDSGWRPEWSATLTANQAALSRALGCETQPFATWSDAPGDHEARPLVCLSWYEAMAFCAWDGGYLPTEAEWNLAAAGGDEQRAYAWSSPAKSLALAAEHASYDCEGDGARGCAVTDLLRPGSRPAGDGRWGHADLSGNVWEWVYDWTGEYQVPCSDCAQLVRDDSAPSRVLRGGSFAGGGDFLRTAVRSSYPPANRLHSVGARCARDVVTPPR
jgi:formylglycine-generating enzyme